MRRPLADTPKMAWMLYSVTVIPRALGATETTATVTAGPA
jgi:hypothetical protein